MIGGEPPIIIDLNVEMARISAQGRAGKLNPKAMSAAVADVKAHFDTYSGQFEFPGTGLVRWANNITGNNFGAEARLNDNIDAVAHKLSTGADTRKFTLEEKRIAYAITIADMYKDGTIARDIAKTKGAHDTPALSHEKQPLTDEKCPAIEPLPGNVKWDGQGSETTARIEAIIEKAFHVATDNGGATDLRVDGLMGRRVIAFLKARGFEPGKETDNQKILDTLIHDAWIKTALGTVTDAYGDKVANVQLQLTNTQGKKM